MREKLAGNDVSSASLVRREAQGLREQFQKLYGEEARVFRAPGRVNLIGEHTDYNEGFVYVGGGGRAERFARAGLFAECARARGNGFARSEFASAAALERVRAGRGGELADVGRGNRRSESVGRGKSSDGRGTFVFGVGGSGGGL